MVNLLGDKKKDEKTLWLYLESLLNELPKDIKENIFYDHVDFHGLVKETDFSNINELVEKIADWKDFTVTMHNLLEDEYELI